MYMYIYIQYIYIYIYIYICMYYFIQQNPDPSAVQDLMKRTFAFRRLKLEDTATLYTICSFLDTYPFLRKETEVRK